MKKKLKFKPETIYEVFWEDACSPSEGGWIDLDLLKKLNDVVLIKTVGYAIAESKKSVTLCATKGEEAFQGAMTIPKVGITKVRKIK